MPTGMPLQKLIRNLEAYALSLNGTKRGVDGEIQLVTGSWPVFFDIEDDPYCHARLPIKKARFETHAKQHSEVKLSEWMPRDGHVYMEVALEGNLPETTLKEWIHDAYRLVMNKLTTDQQFVVLLGSRPYEEKAILNEIFNFFELGDLKKAIRRIARPALLLQTSKCAEKNIPIGATRIGGNPDLDPKTPWPVHSSGKPLTFLMQLNLQELATAGSPFKNLPTEGILAIFSVWGWMVDDDADPHVPEEMETPEWTQCVHVSRIKKAERRPSPRGTHRFKAAPVTFIPIQSFPMHVTEPAIAKLDWNEEQLERYDQFATTFRDIQVRQFAPKSHGSSHQLGGYGLFQQCLPESIESGTDLLFLQLGTDDWASNMMWGDGGELSLIGEAAKLRKGILDSLTGEFQCG